MSDGVISTSDVKIAKVVGENEEGLTLFVPKDPNGVFHLTDKDEFLTLLFVKQEGADTLVVWTPWETQ